jgi:hypothetical protein
MASPASNLLGICKHYISGRDAALEWYTFIHIRNKHHWVLKHYYELQNTERGGIRRQ